jgi:hypothetical protein
MPLVSYDPAATLAAGAELGVIAAILLKPSVLPSPAGAPDLPGAG